MQRISLVLLVWCSMAGSIFGQKVTEFSRSPEAFIEEFGDWLLSYKNRELKDEFTLFEENWVAGVFGAGGQDYIAYSANRMLENRYRQMPDFYQWMKALNSYVANDFGEDMIIDFSKVHDSLMQMNPRKTDYLNFLKFIGYLNNCNCFTGKKANSWGGDFATYALKMGKNNPYLEINGAFTLTLGSRSDTIAIANTTGRFNIMTEKWYGNGGTVTWERYGFSSSTVYAELNHYQVDMKLIEYEADSVTFYHNEELSGAEMGYLKDRVGQSSALGRYPEFRSYNQNISIDNIEDYLEYKGGFGMQGQSIIGSGTAEHPAELWVKQNGEQRLRLNSQTFIIRPNTVMAQNVEVMVRMGFDSIYHPGLYFKLDREAKTLALSANPESKVRSPFSNSYHGFNIYADQLSWPLDSNFMELRSAFDPEGLAFFESENYYSERRYDAIRGNMSYHPLERIAQLADRYNTTELSEEDIAGAFNNKIEYIQPLLAAMHAEGYVNYNTQEKKIYLKDKLFHYLKSWRKEIDYDVIQLTSQAKDKANSRLMLDNYDLEIYGIKRVKLSDSQAVEIFPYEQKLIAKQDRDLDFDGYVRAGRFEFFGKNFSFDYEGFTISLESTDSMMFNFPDKRLGGQLRKVNTVIQDITGVLKIDKPDNKSGLDLAPEYPIFDCTKEAYVYYDYAMVYGGVYDRERFNFKLKPFVVDSLDNFSLRGINLLGTFNSADILPTFDYELSLQPDFSLGFQTETPQEGYPLYKGKGQCFMKIDLSNRGLRGEGNFTFNGSDVRSGEMIFFPDSMKALNTTFIMEDHPQKKFPDVTSEKATVTWSPYKDTMVIAAIDTASYINMYESESFLRGSLVFTKNNMYGNGKFNYKHSIVSSDYFDFKHRKLSADSTQFTLFDLENEREVLINNDSRIKIDFDDQELIGVSNSDTVFTDLPLNQYSTNVPQYRWDYDEKMLYLTPDRSNEEDMEFFFVSTNPSYDSLQFTPKEAQLSLESYSVEVFNIQYITVADCRVKPDSSITIGEDGGLPMLKNAEIRATAENEYHFINQAEVNIFSSKKLTGFGKYQYKDPSGKLWEIDMPEIRTTDSLTTIGIGNIPDSANFYFGPRMRYSGDVSFLSVRKPLDFDGELTVEHPFEEDLSTQRITYKGLVAFDSLYLDMSEPKNIYGERLYTGAFMNTLTNDIYHLFLGKKANPNDWAIYDASGYLYFQPDSSAFIISSLERIFEDNLKSGIWTYKVLDSAVVADGPIGFDYDFDNFHLKMSGLITHDLLTEKTKILATGGVVFPFDDGGVKLMADSIVNFGYFNEDITNDKDFILAGAIRHLEGDRDIRKAVNSIINNDMVLTTKEYKPIIHFSEFELVWDTAASAFVNYGKVGISNIGNLPVNKKVNARIVFGKRTDYDSVSVYIESNPGNWYLFNFDDDVLSFTASDQEFIDQAKSAKLKNVEGAYKMKLSDEITAADTRQKVVR